MVKSTKIPLMEKRFADTDGDEGVDDEAILFGEPPPEETMSITSGRYKPICFRQAEEFDE